MKMRNIFDELYDYDLFHLTEIEDTDGAYRAALNRLVNEDKVMQYLDDIERKISEAIFRQLELLKQTDSCYQKAVLSGDAEKMLGLENYFVYMAREEVFECMVYI